MDNVFDACALIAFIRGEKGAEVVGTALADSARACFAHWVNLCEVYYVVARDEDEVRAEAALQALLDAGVIPRLDLDRPFCCEVGRLRARVKAERLRVSLADCFCMALARRVGGEILTSDHAELDPVVPLRLCVVRFIR
jgi:PIN domain nuclease of toxin-antitoxin system